MNTTRHIERLLLFNLVTDADDPVLGFTTVWINALARCCGHIDVLTMQAGRLEVAGNVRVYSVGKERGYGEIRRTIEFYRILTMLLLRHRYDACFAHMQPLFAIMGAPLLKLKLIPITLWYAHKSVTARLRIAEKMVDHVVTSSADGFRAPSKKIVIVGQGIDTDLFTPPPNPAPPKDRPFTIVSVSRIAPIKRLETIIEAVHLLHGQFPLRLRFIGDTDSFNTDYMRTLQQMALNGELGESIEFTGGLPYDQIADIYRQADVMVNLSNTGSLDKAVLEAMSCGLPVITSNEAYTPILNPWADQLLIPPDAPELLAKKLNAIASLTSDQRRQLGSELRAIVVQGHSLERLVDNLMNVFLDGSLPTNP